MIFIWYFGNIFLYSVQCCQWIALYFDPWLRSETAELIQNLRECLFTFTSQPCIPFQPNQKRLNMAPNHYILQMIQSEREFENNGMWGVYFPALVTTRQSEGRLWPSAYNDDEMQGMINDDSECDGWVETSLNLPVSEFSRGSFAHCDAMGIPAHVYLRQSLSQWGGGWYRKIGIP